ncbi:MAG TPA: FHA domain-containing protein [Dictyobacter sp.]|nr:FHA domain-containing protein [Dictyobacter sp.]
MDKCPYCGAETRPGDNFCLNCGNRLLPANSSPSPQQAPSETSGSSASELDAWQTSSEGGDWNHSGFDDAHSQNAVLESAPAGVSTAQATLDAVQGAGRFILRSDNGEVLQEYPLDKPDIMIGRAPTSDILLSKDKLTSRRHASVHYDQGQYLLKDEHSANGTFVNGQQLEEGATYLMHDGDQVGIGEHELLFRAFGSASAEVENLPTVAESPYDSAQPEMTYQTSNDAPGVTAATAGGDDYGTYAAEALNGVAESTGDDVASEYVPATGSENFVTSVDDEPQAPELAHYEPTPAVYEEDVAFEAAPVAEAPAPIVDEQEIPSAPVAPAYDYDSASLAPAAEPAPAPLFSAPVAEPAPAPLFSAPAVASSSPVQNVVLDGETTFNRFATISAPALPDMSTVIAALSTLDGQFSVLQEQLNATQAALRNHDNEVVQTANQLREGIRQVSERMDTTIADVARSREALAWAELSQLMDDVMNNPRDIEYVTKLARKARELNRIFQVHQNVLNTMAECNNLLRGMIGEA